MVVSPFVERFWSSPAIFPLARPDTLAADPMATMLAASSLGRGEAEDVGRLGGRLNARRFGGGSSFKGDGDRLTVAALYGRRLPNSAFAMSQRGQERPSQWALLTLMMLEVLAMRCVS